MKRILMRVGEGMDTVNNNCGQKKWYGCSFVAKSSWFITLFEELIKDVEGKGMPSQ